MTAGPATVDRILAALGDLAPACRAWAPPPECCCWTGIAMAMDTVRKVAGELVTLTKGDPEPADGSVVLDADGDAWQRFGDRWHSPSWVTGRGWRELLYDYGALRLIHHRTAT